MHIAVVYPMVILWLCYGYPMDCILRAPCADREQAYTRQYSTGGLLQPEQAEPLTLRRMERVRRTERGKRRADARRT